MDITDGFAESLMRTVMKHTRILMKEPNNYESRAEVMWAGSLSHNDITGSRSFGDWACHQLEHELSGMYKVAHGAGLAAVWGSWARYVYQEQPSRFAQYARNVMGIREENDVECALAGMKQPNSSLRKSVCRHPFMKWESRYARRISESWHGSAALRTNARSGVSRF